jgi:hypothetical protein
MNIELGFYDGLSAVSYGLLTLSYMMRDIAWLRVITVFSCLVDLVVYYFIRPGQPMWVQIGFNIVILAINGYQLWLLYRERSIADLSEDAAALYRKAFSVLTPVEFRRVLQIGRQRVLADGEALIEAGRPVDVVAVVTHGRLAVSLNGHPISRVEEGGFVGEISYLTDRPASADVRAAEPVQVFELPREALTRLLEKQPELKGKLEGLWGRLLAERLRVLTDKVGAAPTPAAFEWAPAS